MTDQPKSTFAKRVRTARPGDKRHEVRDDIVQGLMLRIFPSGARTFALESMVHGSLQPLLHAHEEAFQIVPAVARVGECVVQPPDQLGDLDVRRILIAKRPALHTEDEPEGLDMRGQVGERESAS